MYTCCPECETTFRVSAEDLKRAQGKVRCGDCDHIFNAVEYLTEDPTGNDASPTPEREEESTDSGTLLDPANDTGIHALPETGAEAYELEIKAYEKTGEAVSALDSGEDADTAADMALHIDLAGDELAGSDVEDAEYDPAFATIGESATIEMPAPLSDDDLDTVEMPIPDDLRKAASDDDASQDDNDSHEAAPHEIDESVWERIPGVGAAEAGRGIDIDPATDEANPPEDSGTADTTDASDSSEAAAAYDKWASFFGSAEKPPVYEGPLEASPDEAEEATRSYPVNTAADADAQYITAATEEPEDADQLMQEMQVAVDATTDAPDPAAQPETPTGEELQPAEEIVMATGEFGAVEISSSLAESDDPAAERISTYSDADWQPEDWQPDTDEDTWQPEQRNDAPPPRSGRALIAGSLVVLMLAAGFVGQLLHYQRDQLAASQTWGEFVRTIYTRLNMNLYPAWPTTAYEIRGSEAVSGESGPDVMDIRGQVAVISDTPVGLPLVRIVLRDRWSNPVAAQVFTPEEYASAGSLPDTEALLQPNQTINAHVAILDPGYAAKGFELQVCLPRRDTGLECTGQGLE